MTPPDKTPTPEEMAQTLHTRHCSKSLWPKDEHMLMMCDVYTDIVTALRAQREAGRREERQKLAKEFAACTSHRDADELVIDLVSEAPDGD
jgi:hypothetical protein